jgi:hypothetical protein
MTGKKDASYQRVRGHLAHLKLEAAAECLAPQLESAQKEKPSYADLKRCTVRRSGSERVAAARALSSCVAMSKRIGGLRATAHDQGGESGTHDRRPSETLVRRPASPTSS